MNKKAQAAMEFLMTYGWAILVVLIAIGALNYFGILDLSIILPNKCVFSSDLPCKDAVVMKDGIGVMVQNNVGRHIRINTIEFTSNILPEPCVVSCGYLLEDGAKVLLYAIDPAVCSSTGSKSKSAYDVSLEYIAVDTGYTHEINGEMYWGHDDSATLDSSGKICSGWGLVSYWKFDEGSGQIASDSSGNGNDGTLASGNWLAPEPHGPSWTTRGSGYALDFESGSDSGGQAEKDYIRVPNSPTLNPTDEITIAFWMNIESLSRWSGIVSKNSYKVVLNNVIPKYYLELGLSLSGSQNRLIAMPLGDKIGEWHHIAFTYDRSKICSYLDGQLYGSCQPATGSIDTSTENLVIGRNNPGWDNEEYDGMLDEVVIYNRALSPSEILALARS